jgi:hypothetical protein
LAGNSCPEKEFNANIAYYYEVKQRLLNPKRANEIILIVLSLQSLVIAKRVGTSQKPTVTSIGLAGRRAGDGGVRVSMRHLTIPTSGSPTNLNPNL